MRVLRGYGALILILCMSLLILGVAKRDLLQEDVGMVNAVNYGTTFDNVAISAAISAIGNDKRVLFLAAGTWTLNQSVSVPSNITLFIPAGSIVQANAGVTLTLATIPRYDQPYWFTGAGTLSVTDATWPIDVRVYGANGDDADDDTSAITKALTAASTNGGTIQFACGTYLISSTITVLNKANIKLLGPTVSRGSTDTDQCAVLQYTASTGGPLHFDGVTGVEIGSLNIVYTHASYANSTLLRFDQSSGTSSTNQVYVHDSALYGTNASSKAALRLLYMHGTSEVTIERCTFGGAQVGIEGSSVSTSLVTNVRIRDNRFLNTLTVAPIKAGGQAWVVEGNRFVGLANGAGTALITTAVGVVALTYQGNNHGGTNSASTRWIDANPGGIFGSVISGNIFGDTNSGSICVRLVNGSTGVSVLGNWLVCGTGLHGGTDVLALGNYNGSTTPFATAALPSGQSTFQYPSFGAGTATAGTVGLAIGATGGAGGKSVVCYDSTQQRLYRSSTGTDCSN